MDSWPREDGRAVADQAALRAIGPLRRRLRLCEKSIRIVC